ncbi:MAG: hypothetical protein WC451_02785 [Patescibacteria group bacterium]
MDGRIAVGSVLLAGIIVALIYANIPDGEHANLVVESAKFDNIICSKKICFSNSAIYNDIYIEENQTKMRPCYRLFIDKNIPTKKIEKDMLSFSEQTNITNITNYPISYERFNFTSTFDENGEENTTITQEFVNITIRPEANISQGENLVCFVMGWDIDSFCFEFDGEILC